MQSILILFAHPRYENSLVQRALLTAAQELPFVRVHDLYEEYPDFEIQIRREQALLQEYDIIVWQHPFYWYSAPPLLKQWIDLVLEYGWAYGKGGTALQGKRVFNCISAGGSYEVYQHTGRNRFTINEFLRPFEQTATLCLMQYLPPFVVHSSNLRDSKHFQTFGEAYRRVLSDVASSATTHENLLQRTYLNDWQYPL